VDGYTNGILKKFERDKYILIFDYKYLKDFEEKKFDILDSVKEINVGTRFRYAEYWNRCRNGFAAGEVPFCPRIFGHCVGRGGDQVVVKNGEIYLSSEERPGSWRKERKLKQGLLPTH